MPQKTIELAGIIRNLPDNSVPDGTMQEVINLRPRDGAWRPVGPKVKEVSTPTDVRYLHSINENYEAVIGVAGGFLAYWLYLDGVFNKTVTTSLSVGTNVLKFAQLDKSLVVGNNTTKDTTVLIFDLVTLTYNAFDGLPDLPDIQVSLYANGQETVVIPSGSNAPVFVAESTKLIADKVKVALSGPVLLRFAWELVDGTIVKHSTPVYTTTSFFDYVDNVNNMRWNGRMILLGTTMTVGDRIALTTTYKGIIKSLNVYATRMQPLVENLMFIPTFTEPSIADESLYYLVQQIGIEDLPFRLGGTFLNGPIPPPFDSMETRDTLPVDSFSHHKLHGKSMFAYNARIFFGDITMKAYKGYNPASVVEKVPGGFTGATYEIGIEVDINAGDGISTVWSGWATCNYYNADSTQPAFNVAKYFSYPDYRATYFRMFVRSGGIIRQATLVSGGLIPIPLNNFAYKQDFSHPPFPYPFVDFTGPFTDHAVSTLTVNPNNNYSDQNRIQACELNNPLNFPAKNSYRVQGRVIGMSTNAIALSQGQYGQYPVYCFTTEGIWAMNIGNGDLLINTISPLSREVCNNPDSITQIDGGTVFSTTKGLYVLQGTQAIEISQSAEGSYKGRITGTLNYEAIANNPNLYQVKAYLCSASFLNYISGAKIAYDQTEEHKEIIISNPAYKYSWVYSLKYKRWFKISQVFTSFVQDFPVTYGYHMEGTTYCKYSLSEEDYSELVPVHMETRPMKLSPIAFKKINRAVIGGYINNNNEYPFSVNLFGSPDKRNWYLLNASNTFGARSQLIIGRATFSCLYYILVIGGKVDEEAYFTGVDVDFDETFGNKLR